MGDRTPKNERNKQGKGPKKVSSHLVGKKEIEKIINKNNVQNQQ